MRALTEEVARAAAALGRAVPARDVRLDRVAEDVARVVRTGELTSFDTVSFLLSHYGLVEPEPGLALTEGTPGAEPALVEHLRPQLPSMLRNGSWRRLGVGVVRGPGVLRVAIALQEQSLELDPVPRRLAARGAARLAGRLLHGYGRAQVFVTVPAGGVREVPVRQSQDRFEARLTCEAGDGAYQVEIGAEGAQGPTVLANFPVYCGTAPPARPGPVSLVRRGPQDPREAEEELLALVNQARASAGLRPLRVHRRLAEVARAYSREMASTGLVAHVSPRSGSPVDRVQRAGLEPQVLMENVAREYSAAQAHRGLMASPGHRANVLDPRATHIGIGVAAGNPEAGGAVPLFFTQLFAAGL